MNKLIPMAAIIFSIAACSSTPEVVETQEVVVAEDKAEGLRHDQMTLAQAQVAEISQDEKTSEEETKTEEIVEETKTEEVVEETEEILEDTKTEEVVDKKIVYPTTSLLNLRSGHGMTFDVAKVVKFGEKIEITDEIYGGLWLKTVDGLWVSKLFISEELVEKPNDPSVEIEDVAQEVTSEEISTSDVDEEVSESVSDEVVEEASQDSNMNNDSSEEDQM